MQCIMGSISLKKTTVAITLINSTYYVKIHTITNSCHSNKSWSLLSDVGGQYLLKFFNYYNIN